LHSETPGEGGGAYAGLIFNELSELFVGIRLAVYLVSDVTERAG
jgi:hypothetical protein